MPYLREILADGHPTLRKRAKRVDPKEITDPLFQQLIDDMFATMYAAPGVGLAAPQVNVSKRIFVMDVHDDEHEPAVVINPQLETGSAKRSSCGRAVSRFPAWSATSYASSAPRYRLGSLRQQDTHRG